MKTQERNLEQSGLEETLNAAFKDILGALKINENIFKRYFHPAFIMLGIFHQRLLSQRAFLTVKVWKSYCDPN